MSKRFSFDEEIGGIRRGDVVRWLATLEAISGILAMVFSAPAGELDDMAVEFRVLLGEEDED